MMKLLAQVDPDTFNLPDSVGDRFSAITNTSDYNLPNFVSVGIRLLFVTIAVGFFINLLVGATQWILAGGDKEGVEKARKRIMTSIVGLAIGFSVYVIVNLITAVTGIDLLNTLAVPTL